LRLEHHFRADIAARARPVLDHERLAQACAQLVRNGACCGVDAAAGRDVDDDPDWLVGVIRVRLRCRVHQQCAGENDHEETDHAFLPVGSAAQLALTPAAVAIFVLMTTSDCTSFSNADVVRIIGSAPRRASFSCTAGLCSALRVSALSLSRMGDGVFDGANMPTQKLYSEFG